MRKLATIQKIEEMQPVENANQIEKCRIKDWWIVILKNQFKVNENVVYFEIDSFLPITPEFEFLLKGSSPKKMIIDTVERTGIRLKTKKIRGQLSQGLIMPLSILEGKKYSKDTRENPDYNFFAGKDVSELLGVYKYEPPLPASLSGEFKGGFPPFVPKTDEERIQNCGDLLEKHKGELFYVSEKIDGTSVTYYKHNNEFGVCQRNWELKETTVIYWKLAMEFDIRNKLAEGFSIQGEIAGEGVQGNPLKLKGQHLFIYNVWDIKNNKYLDYKDFICFVAAMGLKTVPIINDNFVLMHTVDSLLAMAEGNSAISSNPREGLIFRPLSEQRDYINGAISRLSFKAISNSYLINYE
ncbi:MAG: RNA ligase (ATP) [bacterium]